MCGRAHAGALATRDGARTVDFRPNARVDEAKALSDANMDDLFSGRRNFLTGQPGAGNALSNAHATSMAMSLAVDNLVTQCRALCQVYDDECKNYSLNTLEKIKLFSSKTVSDKLCARLKEPSGAPVVFQPLDSSITQAAEVIGANVANTLQSSADPEIKLRFDAISLLAEQMHRCTETFRLAAQTDFSMRLSMIHVDQLAFPHTDSNMRQLLKLYGIDGDSKRIATVNAIENDVCCLCLDGSVADPVFVFKNSRGCTVHAKCRLGQIENPCSCQPNVYTHLECIIGDIKTQVTGERDCDNPRMPLPVGREYPKCASCRGFYCPLSMSCIRVAPPPPPQSRPSALPALGAVLSATTKKRSAGSSESSTSDKRAKN